MLIIPEPITLLHMFGHERVTPTVKSFLITYQGNDTK